MKLLVAGGTGFIGTALCQALAAQGHELFLPTRSPERQSEQERLHYFSWEPAALQHAMVDMDGVINLAGASITGARWTPQQKLTLQESRFRTTRLLVEAMAAQSARPTVLINASAVGYYGACGDEPRIETSPPGRGFLAELCHTWETEAQRAESLGVRVVRLRLGVVLGPDGGALAKMAPPFRYFLGGPLGSGRQWVSWIHRADVVGLIAWVLMHSDISGAVNVTAPNPVMMRGLCDELGLVLRRPSWVPVPAIALQMLLGEMADMLLTGQRVIPNAALRSQYPYQFPELGRALEACLCTSGSP